MARMILGHGVGSPSMTLQQRKTSVTNTFGSRATKLGTSLGAPGAIAPLGSQSSRARTR